MEQECSIHRPCLEIKAMYEELVFLVIASSWRAEFCLARKDKFYPCADKFYLVFLGKLI